MRCGLPGWLAEVVLAVLTLAVLTSGAQAAPAVDTATDTALEARVNAVSAELRCLVCQNQSLADSHAELAVDLKNQVREQLRSGRNEAQVVAYMTDRYGDFVRYRPPFKTTTLLLWLGPVLLLLIGGGLLWRTLGRARAVPAALSADEQARAEALLQGADKAG
ncbi:Cytochrome c-type biogenesis protein CcmH [Rubrivivax sp. A210]|uniref:cytochrome c-type biogenesis protein n=1 Tax=Rubrivivax sp. A210 TaxID=2772301 RepID=UPI00191ABC41|nr:cytochrome c-type biogenesis protein [Rubrivivax sp. A210]CAD5372326.1 Cytochrome c-type biogenesis protein CcmH [Rubrivivax sp. A210]